MRGRDDLQIKKKTSFGCEAKPPAAPPLEDLQPPKPNLEENQGSSMELPCLLLDHEAAGLIPPRIQDLLCPQCSPLILSLRLLGTAGASSRIPQRFLGAGTAGLRGAGPQEHRKMGKNSLCSGGQELGELHKSSHRVSPQLRAAERPLLKILGGEAASLTTWGFSHLFPGGFTSTFAGKSESLPSCKVRAEPPSFLISQFGNRERAKRVGTQRGAAGKSPGSIFQRWKTGGHPWVSQPWSKHLPLAGIF